MCSYNKVNGIYACENHDTLTVDLKQRMGFKGERASKPETAAAASPRSPPGLRRLDATASPTKKEGAGCHLISRLPYGVPPPCLLAGFVVSDWGATHSTVGSANGGLDLEMPDKQFFGDGLRKALNDGTVPMSRLDDMVRRILRSMYDTGLFDTPQTGAW